MRRALLFAGWLATTVVAGYLTFFVVRAYGPVPRPALIAIGNLPAALLLAAIARRRDWAAVLGAGWMLIALVESTAVDPLLSTVAQGLAPARDLSHIPARSAYLPLWLVFFGGGGLIRGVLSAVLFWWYLRSRTAWVLLSTIAGAGNALNFAWNVFAPMPGTLSSGFFFIGPLITAAALAALWRWEARGPDLRAAFLWGRSPTPAPAGSAAPPAPDATPR